MTRKAWMLVLGATVAVVVVIAGAVLLFGNSSSTKKHVALPSSSSSSSSSVTPTPSAIVPKSGVLFGAAAQPADGTDAGRTTVFTALQKSLGVNLDIIHEYRRWDQPIDTSFERQYIAQHKTLLISWTGTDTKIMASGQGDAIMAERARQVAALKVPVFFEFRWEMDGPGRASIVHSPADYIAAWDRMRKVFAEQKVTNAQFVWCPLAMGFGNNRAQAYYPGDNEVDWVCADVYSPGNKTPVSFANLAGPFLNWAAGHPSKPIMIGEFGAAQSWGSAGRVAWLSAIKQVIQDHPQIKAMLYYNSNLGGDVKYEVNSDPNVSQALASLAKAFPAATK